MYLYNCEQQLMTILAVWMRAQCIYCMRMTPSSYLGGSGLRKYNIYVIIPFAQPQLMDRSVRKSTANTMLLANKGITLH